MWDKFTVRLWAFKHKRAFRNRVLIQIMVGISFLVICLETCYIAQGGKLSLFGFLALAMFITLGIGSVIEIIKGWKND